MELDAAKLLRCVEEITEELADREQAYFEIKRAIAHLTKEENKLKLDKVDVDEKVKNCTNAVKGHKGAVHQLEVKLSQLKLQDIPNETVEELKKYTEEELEEKNATTVEKETQAAQNHLKVAKQNLSVIQEYHRKQTVYVERSKELEAISNERMEMKKLLRLEHNQNFM